MSSKRNRFIFYVSTVAFWFSMYTYVPILSPYVEHMGGSLFFVGIVLGSYGLTQMLLRVPLGIWSDRLGKRKIFILLGMACAALSSLGFTFGSTALSALVFRAVAGVAASSWVLFTVLFSSYFPREEAAKAMGLISFFNSIGQMLATASGGYLAEHYGWHAPFFLGAAVGGIGLCAAFFIQEEKMEERRQPIAIGDLFRMGKEWPLLSISLIAVLAQSIVFTTMFGFTPLQAENLGVSKGDLGVLTLLTTLPNAIAGYISGSMIVKKIGEKQTVILGFILSAICTAVIPFTTSFGMLLVSQACNGFGQGLIFPVLLALAIRNVTPAQRATAMGFFQAIFSLGMFGGPLLAGWIGEAFGLRNGFLFTGVLSIVGAILSNLWIASPAPASYRKDVKKRA